MLLSNNWIAANSRRRIVTLVSAMKLPGYFVSLMLTFTGAAMTWAADATTPLDAAQRNTPFAAKASVTPDNKLPETNTSVQEKRVDKTVIVKQPAAVGERRAPIDVTETREKNVREKDSRRPEKIAQPMSVFDHREAPMSTAADATKPQVLTKYQDGLTSASATNMARFPALDRATGAKINRFVFRKNAPDAAALSGATVTAAGGRDTVPEK